MVDDVGSSGDAALVLVARTHARNTAAVSLPKEGREGVGGGREIERAYTYPGLGLWRCASTRFGVLLACCLCAGFLAGALARTSPWPGKVGRRCSVS